jgi:tetratricopeptide (TPR) repeat protein
VRVTGAARFARVGAVMAEWSGEAPALDGFRELLWAVEQAEADGALWLSAHSLVSAQRFMRASQDLRWAYATAQLGRMLRSVGHLDAAERQFQLAAEHAAKEKDEWLAVRTVLGLGVVRQARGNYPAAHDHYERALTLGADYPDLLLAARIGLVSTSLTRGNHKEAVRHASDVVKSGAGENDEHAVEVLAMLADIGLEVGDFPAAMRACSAAMLRRPPQRKQPFFQRGLMISASILGQEALAIESANEMERTVDQIANRWERAFSRLVLGRVLTRHTTDERGHRQTVLALAEAREHGFQEIAWKAEQSVESLLRRVSPTKTEARLAVNTDASGHVPYEAPRELERRIEVEA